jgi:glutaconyl-CoA/methylmalonyl-CoA decarboxylase subunit delta
METAVITFDPSLITRETLMIAIAGYCIVLLALALMAILFARLHRIQDYFAKRRLATQKSAALPEPSKAVMTGEENAAIAAALFMFFSELHDEEKYVMTIRKVSKSYSPWNSKIYGIWNTMKHW